MGKQKISRDSDVAIWWGQGFLLPTHSPSEVIHIFSVMISHVRIRGGAKDPNGAMKENSREWGAQKRPH